MKFYKLAQFFDTIEHTSSRLSITHTLSELFKKLSQDEIEKAIYLLQGRMGPLYETIESGMAEKMAMRSIALALHIDKKLFEKQYKQIGDLGKTVEYFKKQIHSFEEQELSISHVFDELHRLSTASGEGSQDTKINILAHIIRQIDPLSSRFLVRIPLGIMRLGFSDMTILDALSWSLVGNKSLRSQIQKAYHVRPDLGYIGKILKHKGINGLHNINPSVFTPIIMMRAERLSSGKEIIEKIGKCAIEPKYDGFRLQVHYKNSTVRLYSRNLEEVSHMYPDIIEGVKKEIRSHEVIFEGEAIGFNIQTGDFLPFQETSQRKRKYDIEQKAKEIPLKMFMFDLLYCDKKSFLDTPFEERRKKIMSVVKTSKIIEKDTILIAPQEITASEKRIEILFDDAVTKGLEGILAKKLTGIYQPGARGWNWIKFKRSYASKIHDTIDCLVMGYDFGKGKRSKFGIGAFLVGIYDKKKDMFVTIAKIGTGLSDIEWGELKKRADKIKTKTKPTAYDVDKQMNVDMWIQPEIVVEIKADEITLSPVHTAGRILRKTKTGQAYEVDVPGYALRFPRLQRFRDDKNTGDCTSLQEIKKLFQSQKHT
jgi:DNA ligase-1